MKNSEIHKGLDKKEIRDFLAQSLVKLIEEQMENAKPVVIPYTAEPYVYSIKKAEQDIKYNIEQLRIYKCIQAVIELIKMNGWMEFDVSDETEKDTSHMLKMSFIGTEKEYDFLLLQINGD